MPEFIQVFFPSRRAVLVDGQRLGFTDETLQVTRASHRITLGPPANFVPPFLRAFPRGTSFEEPLLVAFSTPPHPGVPRPRKAVKTAKTVKARAAKAGGTRSRKR